MLKNNLKTCIACDDPITQEGFSLLVCEKCLQEQDGKHGGYGHAFQAKDSGDAGGADAGIH